MRHVRTLLPVLFDTEQSVQMGYELARLHAVSSENPVEPKTLLSGAQRKELRKHASDLEWLIHYLRLEETFLAAWMQGFSALNALPAPFVPLSE